MTYPKHSAIQIGLHFESSEFDCPCKRCTQTIVSNLLVQKLDKLRDAIGKLFISSGYRCPEHQLELKSRGLETAKGISQHELGNAADLYDHIKSGNDLADAAYKAGFMAIGIGTNWIHVDIRDDRERRWVYKS